MTCCPPSVSTAASPSSRGHRAGSAIGSRRCCTAREPRCSRPPVARTGSIRSPHPSGTRRGWRRSSPTCRSTTTATASSTRRSTRFGGVDILVNNAGTSAPMAAEVEPPDVFRQLIDVNLNGLFVLSQLAGRHMIASGGGCDRERGVDPRSGRVGADQAGVVLRVQRARSSTSRASSPRSGRGRACGSTRWHRDGSRAR